MQSFRFEGLSLTVEDVERAVQFYAGTLGLELAHDAAPAFAFELLRLLLVCRRRGVRTGSGIA